MEFALKNIQGLNSAVVAARSHTTNDEQARHTLALSGSKPEANLKATSKEQTKNKQNKNKNYKEIPKL